MMLSNSFQKNFSYALQSISLLALFCILQSHAFKLHLWQNHSPEQRRPSTHTYTNGAWNRISFSSQQLRSTFTNPSRTKPTITTKSTTRLHYKLWERLQIEEDPEPFWYLVNCVAGLEMDLLRQCREVCADMPDAHKFVVPTETKTRSHGANRMVTETKVKYQGYVFAKLRLCPEVYEAIQSLDLCRSWMGTVNHIGHKKLPPAPVALNELEVENFGLEDLEYEEDEEEEQVLAEGEQDVIVDEEGADKKKNEVDEEALKVYLGLKVEDMVKVTKKCKFYEEDGIVRRLKDGKILLRFYTYGTMFEEWMDPGDVRKLSEIEVLKGLQGPTQPVTQRDFDNPGRGDNRYQSSVRQGPGTFRGELMSTVKGARGPRNRRQDRVQRGQAGDFFGRTEDERLEERNWEWYKENRRGNAGVVADDEWQYRPGSRNKEEDDWTLSDVDSQWGRAPPKRQQRRERRQENDHDNGVSRRSNGDWGRFVSPASAPAPSDEDDFFASLMTDLSKDLNSGDHGSNRRSQQREPSRSPSLTEVNEEDNFFASLMAEISDEEESGSGTEDSGSSMLVDDFFSSLDISDRKTGNDKTEASTESNIDFDEDDLFDSFDVVDTKGDSDEDDIFGFLDMDKKKQPSIKGKTPTADEDDFFASLEEELETALEETKSTGALNDGDDNFFSSLHEEVSSKLSSDNDVSNGGDNGIASGKKSAKKNTERPSMNTEDLGKLKVPELKEMLRERGLKVSGNKAELIERLSE